jgi:hypothetical protein
MIPEITQASHSGPVFSQCGPDVGNRMVELIKKKKQERKPFVFINSLINSQNLLWKKVN